MKKCDRAEKPTTGKVKKMRFSLWRKRFLPSPGNLIFLFWTGLLSVPALAENPFLSAKNDQPSIARFRGAEWGDDISDPDDEDEIALTAQVTTTRLAHMPWGSIFKISFSDFRSHASKKRTITPYYFIVTDQEIVLLNEAEISDAIRRISTMDAAPVFDPGDVYAVSAGSQTHEEGLWKSAVETKGDTCTYEANHPSGHFTRLVWKKGVGLIEIAAGRGALADGYRLKRESTRAVR